MIIDRKRARDRGTPVPAGGSFRLSGYGYPSQAAAQMPESGFLHRHVLVNFAKVLTANFDREKLLSHFMNSLSEIAKVSRISVMLREKNTFFVRASKGMDLYLAGRLSLDYRSALVQHLARHGGIVQRASFQEGGPEGKIFHEMDRLQCVVSFPMIYKGKLEGIVNMGEKNNERAVPRR